MRIYTDKLILRICATIMGLVFLAIGVFALIGPGGGADVPEPDGVSWFGITAVIAGGASIVFAWFEEHIERVFSVSRMGRSGRDRRP